MHRQITLHIATAGVSRRQPKFTQNQLHALKFNRQGFTFFCRNGEYLYEMVRNTTGGRCERLRFKGNAKLYSWLHSLFIPVLMSYFNADGIVWIYKGIMINSHKTGKKMFTCNTGSSRTLPKFFQIQLVTTFCSHTIVSLLKRIMTEY